MKKKIKVIALVLSVIVLLASAYLLVAFSGIPFIRYWREIWIETAMTTGDHQWLATKLFPESVINEVMSGQTSTVNVIGGQKYLENSNTSENTSKLDSEPEYDPNDILHQANISVGDIDYAGYKVLVNDIEQGIIISEIVGSNYNGRIMLIDDPSRVYLGVTNQKDIEGLRIKDMMKRYGAVAGINASGFSDPDGLGTGGDVMGMSCNDGVYWGEFVDFYGSVILTRSDRLVVGNISVWEEYDIRDGIQFGPVLIADGKKTVEGSAGYGLHPRTAVGQREDGVIIFLVIDGRDILHSIGCTVGDMADVLEKYGVVNASCCDGGSSSVMAYNGEIITKNSSANPNYGRRLPNAFLVKPKE